MSCNEAGERLALPRKVSDILGVKRNLAAREGERKNSVRFLITPEKK